MNTTEQILCCECEAVALVREPYGDFCPNCWLAMKDTKAKYRKEDDVYTGYHGERVHTSKLTPDDVILITGLLKEGLSLASIAEKFDVSRNTIWTISKRKNWTHITENVN